MKTAILYEKKINHDRQRACEPISFHFSWLLELSSFEAEYIVYNGLCKIAFELNQFL
jgi:hypothetical protein